MGQQNTGDIWSVACKDGGSYRIQVKYDAGASTVYIFLRRIKRGAAGALPVDLMCGSVATGADRATLASRARASGNNDRAVMESRDDQGDKKRSPLSNRNG